MELKDVTHVENIRFGDENSVVIIDQTKLPNETVYLTLTKPEEMYNAIYLLQVRGAPAIGIFAAYSLSVLANGIQADNFDDFYAQLRKLGEYLDSSRPTAVNLHRMVTRMLDKALACKDQPLDPTVAVSLLMVPMIFCAASRISERMAWASAAV